MSIKTLSTALATVAVVAASATAVSAGPAIFTGPAQNFSTTVSLDLVTSEGAGEIQIYNYHGGERGALLGSETVTAGANNDVNISVKPTSSEHLIAVLVVDGSEVATQDLNESKN